jgi:hypothetical protein
MSNKPVEVPKVGFNEALQRIAKFDKEKLPDNLRPNSKEKTAPSKDSAVKTSTK